MSQTRLQAENRYRELRHLAHQQAEAILSRYVPIQIRDIDLSALDAFVATWANHSERLVAWPWPDMSDDFRRKFPERFEAAMWSGDVLCGLTIGKLSHSREIVSIHFIEGSPYPDHPLKGKIHVASIESALAYGEAVNAKFLRLVDPVPVMIEHYVKYGFRLETPKGMGAYCEKEI